MFGSLHTGLSGIRANLRYLDVVGNNLANSATTGFKGDRVTFKDVFYQTYRQPSGPTGNLGGVNGRQIGTGVSLASVDTLHTQGAITGTGRTFDLALEGGGFFAVSDGTRNFYTRAGTFGVDANNNLVDTRTGYKVLNTGGSSIDVSTALSVPAQASTNVAFLGNLPAKNSLPVAEIQESGVRFEEHHAAILPATATAPVTLAGQSLTLTVDRRSPVTINFGAGATGLSLAQTVTELNNQFTAQNVPATASLVGGAIEIASDTLGALSLLEASGAAATTLGLPTTQAQGTEADAGATTDLSDLSANTTDYQAGDVIQITGVTSQGAAVNIAFTYGTDGQTLGDLVNLINTSGAYPDATASLGTDGKIIMTSTTTGVNDMTIAISDGAGGVGATNWNRHAFTTSTQGKDGFSRTSSTTVYDSLGVAHTLTGVFQRQDDGTWNLDLTLPAADGTVAGGPITGITFGSDGLIQGPTTASIDLTFTGGAAASTIALDLTGAGGTGGLTMFDGAASAKGSADGYTAGELASYEVTAGGEIIGRYSNGVDVSIDTIGVATFQNQDGLSKEGSTLFAETSASGAAVLDQAAVGNAGAIVSGSLEGSNVDIAEEFVRLIEAQRAFQGNARVVTKTDEMLAELTQIV